MGSVVRNRGCHPQLESEGIFLKPLVQRPETCFGTNPFFRANAHHTLSSARKAAFFQRFPYLVPDDSLDLSLASTYNHSYEIFPEKFDYYLQPETLGEQTWRRLKNVIIQKPLEGPRTISGGDGSEPVEWNNLATSIQFEEKIKHKKIPYKYNKAHDVIIGGVMEKKHPCNIKLMNSSHHSPQTNAGYTRQPAGMVFQY